MAIIEKTAIIKKTPRFENSLAEINEQLKHRVEKRISRLEKMTDEQVIQSITRRKFDANFYILKIDDLRIPIQTVEVKLAKSTPKVFFLLDVLHKTDEVYKKLQDSNQKQNREKYLTNFGVDEKLLKSVKEQLLEEEKGADKRKKLPAWLFDWLDLREHDIEDERIWIYESYYWVENTLTKNFRETYWPKIYKLLSEHIINSNQDFLDHESELAHKLASFPNLRVIREGKVFVVYEFLCTQDKEMYFLYNFFIYEDDPSGYFWESAVDSITKLYERENLLGVSRTDLTGYALRTYPDFILYDDTIWQKIELDERSNLSLSAEEKNILTSTKLPVFINGQAGSGKSSILYYLFASYLHKKIASPNSPKGTPLFLTFNEKLVEKAKNDIGDLLRYHHSYVDKTSAIPNFESRLQDILSKSILPYKNFLLKLCGEFGETSQFDESKFVGFNQFQRFYLGENLKPEEKPYCCRLRERQIYSPEIAWHVVRTYIKGYRAEGELTPEEYYQISDDDKTVSYEAYKEIYHSIWERWYKNLWSKYGLWDQQDLTRMALLKLKSRNKNDNDQSESQYPVIFCDEAQDFTRIELELILRVNAFYGYDLSEIEQIPLAFAGDPFQTVNPSGFRWEYLKSTFYSKFKELQFPVQINDVNLTINFRSFPRLVKFGNLIQFFRHFIRDPKELRYNNPQLNGIQIFEGEPANLFEIGRNIDSAQIKKLFREGNIFIVPTDYGGEEDYIKKHEEYFPSTTEIENVFSPLRIKGMEHDKIVIFNFGEEFGFLIKQYLEGHIQEDEMIQLQYAFNKIYVAITRAKKDLYIIDTPKGVRELWKFVCENQYEEYLQDIDNIEIRSKWNRNVIDSWKYGQTVIFETDLEKIAHTLKTNGEISQDADILMRSATYFRRINDTKNELECLTQALELEGKFCEAGDKYSHPILNNKIKASECYWNGRCWEQLLELHSRQKDLRYYVAVFMLEENYEQTLQTLNTLFAKGMHNQIEPNDSVWKDVVDNIRLRLDEILDMGFIQTKQVEFDKLLNYLERLAERGFPEFYLVLGKYSFLMGRYRDAIEYWDRTEGYNEETYHQAKFYVSSNLDDKIYYARRLNWPEKIVEIWEENGRSVKGLTRDSIKSIKEAVQQLQKLGDLDYLNFLMENFTEPEDCEEVMNLYQKYGSRDKAIEIRIIDYIMSSKHWSKILNRFIKESFLEDYGEYVLRKMLDHPNPTAEEKEFTLNHICNFNLEELEGLSLKIIQYYYTNRCYLDNNTRKVHERMKEILLRHYLAVQYSSDVKAGEKKISKVDVNKSMGENDIIYALGACVMNNDEFYFRDRLRIFDRVLEYAERKGRQEEIKWAREVWLYLQKSYVQWLRDRSEKPVGRGEFEALKRSKREEVQTESTLRREEDKLREKQLRWKQIPPDNLSECPVSSDKIFPATPFILVPANTEVIEGKGFHQLIFEGFSIKAFRTDRRLHVVNDELDVNIRISFDDFYVNSMGVEIKIRKINENTKEFWTPDKYIVGIVRKNGNVDITIGKTKVKLSFPVRLSLEHAEGTRKK